MKLVRFAALLAATLIAGLATPSPALAAPTVPFYADSGGHCIYGISRGTIEWRTLSSAGHAIAAAVDGSILDRPTPIDPVLCPNDGRFSVVTFTAYSGNLVVDREARRADNGVVPFTFVLGSNVSPSPTPVYLTRVVIQVCRHVNSSTVPVYCGAAVVANAP